VRGFFVAYFRPFYTRFFPLSKVIHQTGFSSTSAPFPVSLPSAADSAFGFSVYPFDDAHVFLLFFSFPLFSPCPPCLCFACLRAIDTISFDQIFAIHRDPDWAS